MRPLATTLASLLIVPLTACTGDSGGTDSAGSETGGATSGESAPTTGGPSGETGGPGSETGGSATDSATGSGGTVEPTSDPGGSTSGDPTSDSGSTTDDSTTGPVGPLDCLFEPFVNQGQLLIDYAQFDPVIGSHCKGTNHQDITDIERVVFLGDSVTVGTPPTQGKDFYRSELADMLVEKFGLMPPNDLWKQVNPIDGVALVKDSGDFSSCSKWGARTDDFVGQTEDCFPPDLFDKRTLIITTMGGNDLASIAKDGANGKPIDEVTAAAEAFIQLQREAVQWFVDDPDKFPNGVFVVYANIYEFTDGTGDLMSCPAAGLGGFDKPWEDPQLLKDLVLWINEQYMDIAVDTQTDMIFLLENFCGHGFKAGDPTAPCYRGPDNKTLFDLTCIHPNPDGHDLVKDLFTAVIDE
ncbi:MAG: hypothetical protein IPO88_15975 [Nannocystis sp.]|uniref:GDSL-type esterase/lipase family protein n=1 Tax=Nannocystis sp. TaxID=1962667 RepID=UPI00242250B6|nr:GDSL-type esterase/lipase family protein [Nannocystis sp.]MBK9754965.1 hypothetical protein [Nannocystis sp.]